MGRSFCSPRRGYFFHVCGIRTVIADRFECEQRLLGRGGMSEVWLARDRALDRLVAVKILSASASASRFTRENSFAASLDHPNIVGVFDYGEFDGKPCLVLEYLPGGTLEDLIAREEGPLEDGLSLSIARDIAAGLAHAHERGVIHRDLKPSNILFDIDGRAKWAILGLHAPVTDTGAFATTGSVLGTALYMSPEQAAGDAQEVGPESDVYGFGLVLYRLITGRLPFEANSPIEAAAKRLSEPLPAVEEIRANTPSHARGHRHVCAGDRSSRPSGRRSELASRDRRCAPVLDGHARDGSRVIETISSRPEDGNARGCRRHGRASRIRR